MLYVSSLRKPPKRGIVIIDVFLDIRNAFNSISWNEIGRACTPNSIILKEDKNERKLIYPPEDDLIAERNADFHRGSYSPSAMKLRIQRRIVSIRTPCRIVCYADATIILSRRGGLR